MSLSTGISNGCLTDFIGSGNVRSPFTIPFTPFFEQHKYDKDLTYPTVLEALYSETGRVERSFSSKILATVRPELPVWDKYVLENLGEAVPPYGSRNLAKIIAAYDDICAWYQSDEALRLVPVFDAHFPNIPITNTKKIDFILWQTR